MFWIAFRNSVFILLIPFLLIQCQRESTVKESKKERDTPSKTQPSKSLDKETLRRQVENKLKITAAEDYDLEIFYEYINPDTLKDAVILVNRKEHAFQQAKSNKNERFFESLGYTGPHNHILLKLGGSDELITTTPIGSNVLYPLQIQFLEMTSVAHRDFYVDYRIRNSMQRNYYTYRNNNLHLTFSCPVFDSIGEKKPLVYDIQVETSSVRTSKDIALYKAHFSDYNPSKIEDVNYFTPKEIASTNELFLYFIFDEKTMKYKSPMAPPPEK